MRIALIGPSHWHFAMYREGLAGQDIKVVGITDPNESIAAQIAADYHCPHWSEPADMLEAAKPEFVFAFGAHAHMPAIARLLIGRRIPFSIEKPCGVNAGDVARTRRLAEAAGVFVSVPFHYRISDMARTLSSLLPLPSQDFLSMDFRVNAGSPLRYEASSPWLADPVLAGGGCMMNLAHHPIDFMLQLTGAEVVEVSAQASNKLLGLGIEDHALLSLKLSDGTIASIETGYTHVSTADCYMDFNVSMCHRTFCAQRRQETLLVRHRHSGETSEMPTDWMFKSYFAHYARQTLNLAVAGQAPIAGLADLERTMRVLDAGYASLRQRTPVNLQTTI